jgi:hypothetical protein
MTQADEIEDDEIDVIIQDGDYLPKQAQPIWCNTDVTSTASKGVFILRTDARLINTEFCQNVNEYPPTLYYIALYYRAVY